MMSPLRRSLLALHRSRPHLRPLGAILASFLCIGAMFLVFAMTAYFSRGTTLDLTDYNDAVDRWNGGEKQKFMSARFTVTASHDFPPAAAQSVPLPFVSPPMPQLHSYEGLMYQIGPGVNMFASKPFDANNIKTFGVNVNRVPLVTVGPNTTGIVSFVVEDVAMEGNGPEHCLRRYGWPNHTSNTCRTIYQLASVCVVINSQGIPTPFQGPSPGCSPPTWYVGEYTRLNATEIMTSVPPYQPQWSDTFVRFRSLHDPVLHALKLTGGTLDYTTMLRENPFSDYYRMSALVSACVVMGVPCIIFIVGTAFFAKTRRAYLFRKHSEYLTEARGQTVTYSTL